MNKAIRDTLQATYLDYVNDYLTIAKYAEHNRLTVKQAATLITLGSSVHEAIVAEYKEMELIY